MSEIGLFLWAVLAHWQSYVTGGFITAVLGIYERKTDKTIPWRLYVAIFLVTAGLVAMFYAWHDEHHNAQVLIEEKASVWGSLNTCLADYKIEHVKAEFLDQHNRSQQGLFNSMQQNLNQQIGVLANSQTAITSLVSQIGRLTPLQPQHVTVRTYPFGTTGLYASGVQQSLFIVVAVPNRPLSPVHGAIICEHPFAMPPSVELSPDTGPFMRYTKSYNGSEIEIGLTAPIWMPDAPLVVQGLAGDKAGLGSCKYEERPTT
jgi:hypothetical protein